MVSPKSNIPSTISAKWQTYRAAFGPHSGHVTTNMSPLRTSSLPMEIIERCPELEQEWQIVQADVRRVFSCTETSDDCSKVKEVVDDIHTIAEKQGDILKRARTTSATWTDLPESKRRKLADQLFDTETPVLRIRTVLASSKKTVCGEIISQQPTALLRDALFDHILAKGTIEWPAGATITKVQYNQLLGSSERGGKQTIFRKDLIAAYSPETRRDERGFQVWEPILGDWIPVGMITASHIVPLSVGDYDYARLVGQDWPTEDTTSLLMWSEANGLLLHKTLERYLDTGAIVIVPVPSDNNTGIRKYKMVILHEEVRDQYIIGADQSNGERVFLRDLDGRQLTWLNDKRPDPTNLYIRYLLTRVFRRKVLAQGWQHDIEKVPSGEAWAEIGPLRYRMLSVLCEEIGDFVGSTNDPSPKPVLSEQVDILPVAETESELHSSRHVVLRMAENFTSDQIEKAELGEDGY